MKIARFFVCALFLFALGFSIPAAPKPEAKPVIAGKIEGQILAGGARRVLILSPAGEILWQHPTVLASDAWLLPNGNILYADGPGVTELDRAHKVVWEYKPATEKKDATYACQRLANGNTLVGENSTGRVLEVAPDGKIVFTLQISPAQPGAHHNMRLARKLKTGNYLVCQSGAHLVREYAPDGSVLLELKVDNIAYSAVRTPQNTTLVGCLDKLVEFDAAGKIIWEFKNTDLPGVTIGSITGIHLLPNGNIAVGCYRAYTKDGKGVGLLEITRDKKLVWSYAAPAGPDGTMMPIQVLTEDGKPLPGEPLR